MKLSRAILAVVLFVTGYALWSVAESSLDKYMTARHELSIELVGE
jgi:hypothetical protein